MHDKALVLANTSNVDTSVCVDARLAPTIAAWVWASDTLPLLEGVGKGTEDISLIISPAFDFTTSGTCFVSWKLISTATADVAGSLLTGAYITHWASGQILPSTYKAGRAIHIVPLSPRQDFFQYITLVGLFTDDGLDGGRVTAMLSRPETMCINPPANAI